MLMKICNLGKHGILTVTLGPHYLRSTLIIGRICRRKMIGIERYYSMDTLFGDG